MNQKNHFDIVIIGGGPGGYVAAIRAAGLKKKVALIEKNELGGTCLNIGCIPSKTLIMHASFWEKIHESEKFGIKIKDASFDFSKIKHKKDEIVLKLRNSLKNLISKNKITVFQGSAQFLSPNEIKVEGKDNLVLSSEKIIIASGSKPQEIKQFPVDKKQIFDSTSILDLETLPKSMAIIGGGYIGSEFACLYNQFGVKVTIIESKESILSGQEKTVRETIHKSFLKRGISIFTSSKVTSIEKHKNLSIVLENGEKVEAEIVLLAVGRKCTFDDLALEKSGVLAENGAIITNEYMQTNVPGIYAIGDVNGKCMLAHVASHEGIIAAENAFGAKKRMNFETIPSVIFITPEVASVGLTSIQAEEKGYSIMSATFPLSALGQAQASLETEGFAQIIADKKTKQVLGAHIVGSKASIMIGEMALAVANELTIDCIIDTIHPHPTLSEAWLEASLIANGTPINYF